MEIFEEECDRYKQIIVQADVQYGGCQSVLLTEEKYEGVKKKDAALQAEVDAL